MTVREASTTAHALKQGKAWKLALVLCYLTDVATSSRQLHYRLNEVENKRDHTLRDLTPEYDECFYNHSAYEDQGWFKLKLPLYGRSPSDLQRQVTALILSNSGAGAPSPPALPNAAELVSAIYKRTFHFEGPDLARARTHAGDGTRLRRAVTKLLQGKPISALILGGSIEAGADLQNPLDSYFGQVSAWINTTFPPQEGQHTFHNGGRASTGSPYFASCLHDHVPDVNVDLVFMQFDINDGVRTPYMNNAHRRALEVLMRKVLMLPGRPALVYLHWWSPTTNQGSRSFWNHTVQPESGLLAEYYGLPALSMRDVWYPKWAANEPGFLSRDVMCGINHPNYLGHQYFSDLIIAFLQDHLAAAALLPAPEDEAIPETLPEPMLPGNDESGAGMVCLHDDSLMKAGTTAAVSGFQWADDITSYGSHRWGWVSETPGDILELQVDTTSPDPAEGSWMSVAVLMSYQDMGMAKLQCARGCVCNSMVIDSLWKTKLSIKEWWHFKVTSSPECIVRLTSQKPARAGGTKFKVEALTVRPKSTGWFDEGLGSNNPAMPGSELHHHWEQNVQGKYGGAWHSKMPDEGAGA